MQDHTVNVQNQRSTFVTVVAWIFIVITGFTTFVSMLQNIMINMMAPFGAMQIPPSSQGGVQIPAFFQFMLSHMRIFFLSFLVVSTTALTAAIGVLRRLNWARLLFIAVLVFGIVWNLGGLILQKYMLSSMETLQADAPADFRADFDNFTSVIRALSIVFAIGFSASFAWIIRRLISTDIRNEFT